MVYYNMNTDYEMVAKHCPRCESLVMAAVVRTMQGTFYKYRDVKCPVCGWRNGR